MLGILERIAICFLLFFLPVLLAPVTFGLVRCLLPLCLDALGIVLCILYQTERRLVFKTNMATLIVASSKVGSVFHSLCVLYIHIYIYICLRGFEGCGIRVNDGLAL